MNRTNFTIGQEVVLKIITGSNAYKRLPKEAFNLIYKKGDAE